MTQKSVQLDKEMINVIADNKLAQIFMAHYIYFNSELLVLD